MGQPQVSNKLVDVSTSTGLLSNPRDIGLYYLTGIATQPGTGNLFGLTSTFSNPANTLIRIDILTGLPTVVGPTGLQDIVEGDLAFNPIDGMLYGLADGPTSTSRHLFKMNPNTGIATVMGNLATSGDFSSLAFNANGTMYTINSTGMTNSVLNIVNPMTATILSSIVLDVNLGSAVGMAFDPITGIAYVADNAPSLASGGTNSVYSLDVATGITTLLGPTGDPNGLSGLAFVSVPEPSSFLLVGGGALAFWRWRRRKVVALAD